MSNASQSALRGRPRDPGKARTAFGGIDKSSVRRSTSGPDYSALQQSAEFRTLRRRLKLFVFPMTAFFLTWYFTYVLVAAYAPDFMAEPLFGEVNVGLLMGLAQFVTTLLITTIYARYAVARIDPVVDELHSDPTGGAER
ncbi:DUF485 domain-containing protein [Parasphingorhabdus pacifica]